ncbi:putative c-terminal src similarity 3 domain of growth factor receptor-bound protein 2, partial [Trichonephila clavata]
PPYQSTLFTSWEVLLQEIEVDSQVHGDIARSLGRQVGMMLLEKTFHRKIQSRKIFLHRESFETILSKAEELLNKNHRELPALTDADDIDVVARTLPALKEAFLTLKTAAIRMGLVMNENNSKNMLFSKDRIPNPCLETDS